MENKSTLEIPQFDLVTNIMAFIGRVDPDFRASPRQINSIVEAANIIVKAFSINDTKAVSNEGLKNWLKSDEVGLSSKVMASVLAGDRTISSASDHPRDPDDFSRCRKLLRSAPDLALNMEKLKSVSPVWDALVCNWDLLCKTMDQECENWQEPGVHSCLKTFSIMKSIGC